MTDRRKPMGGDYEVGYAKPPRHSQFMPGQSGNKGRRKKRPETQAEIIARVRDEPVTVNGRTMTKFELAVHATINQTISRDITAAVLRIFERIWREGYGWRKAGVLLLDLAAPGAAPASLFDVMEVPDDGLMQAIDRINDRYGRGTARLGLAQKDAEWRMRRENLSPSFTTRWGDIPAAKMG